MSTETNSRKPFPGFGLFKENPFLSFNLPEENPFKGLDFFKMNPLFNTDVAEASPFQGSKLMKDAWDYWVDASQRSILFMDILRKRGNSYLEIAQKGLPPVLTFDYEVILDGRSLERPVNHDLVRIIPKKGITVDPGNRPVVVIDPRAGHGPGIGGSKRDSQIGMALQQGHPVYFILFYPDPEPGQTYDDVKAAQTRFIEEVNLRHPNAEEAVVIGNCQAGWALALLSADRPDVTGPLVMNGSPLSYWAGTDGKNPMRYRGGLFGGIWMTSLLCDLGNGKFDGANLVMNFEDLNPANTYWTKQYNVWANADTEEERYLNFEKWWNSYFMMNADEIHFILKNLFVGNRLESGHVELDKGRAIDLKSLEDPVVVFASGGDNITPPQQALNWVAKVYGSVEEIRRCQQVIVYRVHEKVGHLGIFVSGSVAKKEHKEIIENIERLEFLPPGLYEMVLEEKERVTDEGDHQLRVPDYYLHYEERDISDIMKMDDGQENEAEFRPVAVLSELNDQLYHKFLSPLIRMQTTEESAERLRNLHPMRVSRYAFSDRNPLLLPVRDLARTVRENRKPVSADNPFSVVQQCVSDSIIATLDGYRDMRDATHEYLFKAIYGNPLVGALLSRETEAQILHDEDEKDRERNAAIKADTIRWMEAMEKGGVKEGLARVARAMIAADKVWDEREFEFTRNIVRVDPRFKDLSQEELKQIAREQSRILQTDHERALAALPKLLPTPEDRLEAYDLAYKIAHADFELADAEETLLSDLQEILMLSDAEISEITQGE
ncbi:DUF3141 domain-containing protein [Desulfonema ishimotonii]|uniref:DUF3141 domain-containing protein n=1 Tax=Desulfonema ishimotonii TaxID=45657 RepID=A0A401FYL0_9BACT|nr:DUF3141 domain-containing protein [Desulfonema ishimotonii]GBC62047.1 DUF3141 domain-containing protein [Desulfonema ishimotonii]